MLNNNNNGEMGGKKAEKIQIFKSGKREEKRKRKKDGNQIMSV
jgi:hypothetical protein